MAVVNVLLPWGWVRVTGQSMTPTLQDGDRVMVRYGASPRPGQVVLGRFRSDPDLAVIKRLSGADGPDWWLASDNPRAGADSRTLGPARVDAVAIRLWPVAISRAGTSWLRRLAGQPIPLPPPDGL
jgi:nickel-type superoxide dismutase maturation protease